MREGAWVAQPGVAMRASMRGGSAGRGEAEGGGAEGGGSGWLITSAARRASLVQ